ncbi:MAG: metallophosphoesterase family protein, partial [Sulfurimonas sp.]|nr:metallophosphoesterase family protein [Sulfurimonas sp.]
HLMEHHDEYNLVQEPYYFKLAGLKFKLMHQPFYMAPDADVLIYGHTHYFDCELQNGTLFLNSGEICARKKPISECAMLEVLENKFLVTHYTKKEDETKFKSKKFQYKREK